MVSSLADEVRDLLARRAPELGVPGVVVGVVDGDETAVVAHGHPAVDDPRAVDGRTLFQIGSVSKPLTALVVGSLVAEDRLDLDAPIADLLPTSSLPAATIRDLLTHRLGIDGDALLTRPPAVATPAGAVDALTAADPLGVAGGPFSYSNAAFSVLGRIVEVVDDRPFAESLRRRLTRPLRMRRTVTTADEAIAHTVALPHDSAGGSPQPVPGGMGWQPRWELGAHDVAPAGVISCADDLVALLVSLLGGDRRPVPDEIVRDQWSPIAPVTSDESIGLGWLVRGTDDERLIWHPGVTAGYCSVLALLPERRRGWVVLTNGTAGGRLHREVGELLGAPTPPPTGAAQVPPPSIEGTYVGGLGRTTVEVVDDEVLLTHDPLDDGRWQPFPDAPVRLRCHGDELRGVDAGGGPVVVPFGGDDEVSWLRWGRRLRVRPR
ncbi:MAG: serine hydrolase domain-containing protein [Actinomycetota bacterium]